MTAWHDVPSDLFIDHDTDGYGCVCGPTVLAKLPPGGEGKYTHTVIHHPLTVRRWYFDGRPANGVD